MTSVLTAYLDEFASADLRGVVVVGEGHAQLASFHEHGGLKTRCSSAGVLASPRIYTRVSALLPTLNFFLPMVSMSHSLPMVKVLVTLASVG